MLDAVTAFALLRLDEDESTATPAHRRLLSTQRALIEWAHGISYDTANPLAAQCIRILAETWDTHPDWREERRWPELA